MYFNCLDLVHPVIKKSYWHSFDLTKKNCNVTLPKDNLIKTTPDLTKATKAALH